MVPPGKWLRFYFKSALGSQHSAKQKQPQIAQRNADQEKQSRMHANEREEYDQPGNDLRILAGISSHLSCFRVLTF